MWSTSWICFHLNKSKSIHNPMFDYSEFTHPSSWFYAGICSFITGHCRAAPPAYDKWPCSSDSRCAGRGCRAPQGPGSSTAPPPPPCMTLVTSPRDLILFLYWNKVELWTGICRLNKYMYITSLILMMSADLGLSPPPEPRVNMQYYMCLSLMKDSETIVNLAVKLTQFNITTKESMCKIALYF